MPEVPLWNMKVDGEPLPPPDEKEETTRPKMSPEQEMKLEMPHLERDSGWYEDRKQEYEKFVRSGRHLRLKKHIEEFLTSPCPVEEFIARADVKTGPEAWCVLRAAFDKCNDEKIVNSLVEKLWKGAVEWATHEKHRDLTLREVSDMFASLSPPESPKEEKKEEKEKMSPEFDRNYRFFRLSELDDE